MFSGDIDRNQSFFLRHCTLAGKKLDLIFLLVEIRLESMGTNRLTVTYLKSATFHRQDQ